MRTTRGFWPFAALVLLPAPALAQSLVKDIRPGLVNPSGLSSAGALFAASSILYVPTRSTSADPGDELWTTDGTPAGTERIWTAPDVSSSASIGDYLELPNGKVFFVAGNTFQYGRELHVSDGTAAGTALVLDILPGNGSGLGSILGKVGNQVLLTANDGVVGQELWISDGTPAGTSLVADIRVGPASSQIKAAAEFQGRYFFVANDGVHDNEVWVTDGTTAGTQMLADLNPAGGSLPKDFAVLGSTLLFSAYEATNGIELYRTDGTTGGTTIVANIAPAQLWSSPANLTVVGSTCFFAATDTSSGIELWQTDGNVATQVEDIFAGAGSSSPADMFAVNGKLLFTADDGVHGREIWSSDGTAAGTDLVVDFMPGSASTTFPLDPIGLSTGTHLVFSVASGTLGVEPWITDGTAAGTMLLKDIRPGASLSSSPFSFTLFQGSVYFGAFDDSHGAELWVSDLTTAGTVLARDFAPDRPAASGIANMTALGDVLVFTANDGVNGNELWLSDGTTAGTQIVDLNPVLGASSSPSRFRHFDGRLFFVATTSIGTELWATDGTPGGTALVRDIVAGSPSSDPNHFTVWHGALYFSAGTSSRDLWRTDGTTAGTAMVANLAIQSFSPSPLMALPDRLLVESTTQLYTSDGTAPGTVLVDPANGVSVDYNATTHVIGNVAYFFGNRGGLFDLWRTDGTAAGTQHVYTFSNTVITFVGGSYELAEFQGQLLVVADHGASVGPSYGRELFVSDGTTAGTMLLKDIAPFPDADGRPQGLTPAHDRVFFFASEPTAGRELWVSDGTTAGTVQVADPVPGIDPGVAGGLGRVGIGRRVVFVARPAATGSELWVSDGSLAGTHQLFELNPGPASGVPGSPAPVVAGRNAFFVGDDGSVGPELFVFPAVWLEAAEAQVFGSGCPGTNGVPVMGWEGVPALGDSTFAVDVENALASFPVLLLAGDTRTDVVLGGGCTLYPTGPAISLLTTASPAGAASVPVPVPNTTSLVGTELILQWATIDPAGPFLGLAAFSEGLRVRVGSS